MHCPVWVDGINHHKIKGYLQFDIADCIAMKHQLVFSRSAKKTLLHQKLLSVAVNNTFVKSFKKRKNAEGLWLTKYIFHCFLSACLSFTRSSVQWMGILET